ncbi:4-amino-4-deoxy-L-arabinose transferase-like glycosyltransferase [Arthrobacter woluwensis]|nr:4-amino-4-deoxy-L-arabinose transferase-like glycosyltransferase [Arthrobacter woluwensis]
MPCRGVLVCMTSSPASLSPGFSPTLDRPAPRTGRWGPWPLGLLVLGLGAATLTVWGVWSGSRSEYYASIALSMSQNWHNFFFGAFDPSGTVTLDKIPGSFWIPALFVRLFGFSTLTVVLPNALAAVTATLLVAVTAKRVAGTTAGLVGGAVVATTPILVAVSRSNQAETFFVLGLALTAWAAVRALEQRSLGWFLLAGAFVAVSFQTYMLEAWAVWPALAAAYLCTAQPWWRKLWHTALAGVISLALSLVWIVAVALIPATGRPYVGSTLHNDPWEMVFGYNGLGRFGTSTADSSAYNSFTPPFSGSAGAFRLFNEQLAGQIGWLVPVALLAVVVLAILRFRPAVTVFLGVWILTFAAMFSAVAGMHQFYTAALAVPMGLAVGLAIGVARRRRVVWAQLALLGAAMVTAVAIAFVYGGYSVAVAAVQVVLGLGAMALILRETRRGAGSRLWTSALLLCGLLLTPAAWSVVTIAHPNASNPVAGGVSGMSFGGRGGPDGAAVRFGGNRQGFGQGQPGALPGIPPNGFRGRGLNGAPGGTGFPQGAAGGREGTASTALLAYLRANRGDADYLVAAFGAQEAAGLITGTGGEPVLPIGGFSGNDPAPTLQKFTALVSSGALKYVLVGEGGRGGGFGGGFGGAPGGSTATTTASEIRTWVEANCTAVTADGVTGLYQCTATAAQGA